MDAPQMQCARTQGSSESLDPIPLDWNARIQGICGALMLEALRPLWNEAGGCADAAQAILRWRDPELTDAIEHEGRMLFGRHRAEVERMLRAP